MKRIHLHTRPHIALLLFGVMLPGSAVDAFALEVLVSADGEGKIEACSTCRRHLGGIAKRSSAVTAARQDSKGLLLVDAGNFLLGHGSLASGGKVIVDAYNVMAYDAANVSYRDFREGKDTLLKALASAKFAAVSANLFDAESGKPLFKPYAIKEVNGKRVAIIGITESPDGLDYLPHLQAQLQGVRIALPGEAVAKALAKLEGKADRFVLLFYGSAPSLARAVKGVEEKFDVVAVGGANEGDLPQALRARSVVGPEHGRILGRAVVESGKAATVSRINIVPTLPQ